MDVHLISVINISCIHNVFYCVPKAPYWMYFRSYKDENNTNVAACVLLILLPSFYFKVSYALEQGHQQFFVKFNSVTAVSFFFHTSSINFTHLSVLKIINFSSASFAEHFVDYYTPICSRG